MTKLSEMTETEWAEWVDNAIGTDEFDESFHLSEDWFTQIEYEEPFVDPYMYVIGMDPGGTTGVACLRLLVEGDQEGAVKYAKPELGYLHQIPDGRYGFKTFFNDSEIADNVVIVSEKWKERNQKGADREPQYIEGGIHMLWGEENVVWQYPDQKELIPDQWLKDNNLWTPGKRHQMDALKHAFAYLRNSGNSATLESLSGQDSEPMAQPGETQSAQLSESGDASEGAQQFAEAMSGLAQEAQEAMQELAEAMGDGPADADSVDFEDGSDADSDGEAQAHSRDNSVRELDEIHVEDKSRSRREVNGAFAGYNPADEEIETVTILFEE